MAARFLRSQDGRGCYVAHRGFELESGFGVEYGVGIPYACPDDEMNIRDQRQLDKSRVFEPHGGVKPSVDSSACPHQAVTRIRKRTPASRREASTELAGHHGTYEEDLGSYKPKMRHCRSIA